MAELEGLEDLLDLESLEDLAVELAAVEFDFDGLPGFDFDGLDFEIEDLTAPGLPD